MQATTVAVVWTVSWHSPSTTSVAVTSNPVHAEQGRP
jgi:hypothetical protein